MASSSSDSDSESSCSSDDILDQVLLDDMPGDDELDPIDMTKNMVETVAIHVPIIVATIMLHNKGPHGGSIPGRLYIHRDRRTRHNLIMKDYFMGSNSKYTSKKFRRRFRMDSNLFKRILHEIRNYDSYFTRKVDAVGKDGLSPLQKMVAAFRMLAYGCPADLLDEYVQIGESTALESLRHFCNAVIGVFEERYLRKPNEDDIRKLLKQGENRGFPGMLGSLDCMHWHWKNCPTAWHGTHTGHKRVPTLILEAVASEDLWIWHAFFGMAGTNNDITVLDRSPLFDDLIHGVSTPCNFMVQGHNYNMGYYLTDGIYPPYATLIQSISNPSTVKEKLFAEKQEAARKDVERAFGVLQSRWHIIKGPSRMWKPDELGKIMKTCIILHNMIIENERQQGINPELWKPSKDEEVRNIKVEHDYAFLVSRMINRMKQIRDKTVHDELRTDLINHIWSIYGDKEC